jgi:hypothetical protein
MWLAKDSDIRKENCSLFGGDDSSSGWRKFNDRRVRLHHPHITGKGVGFWVGVVEKNKSYVGEHAKHPVD